MISILSYILIATLFSFGWCALFNEGMILEKIGTWVKGDDYKKGHLPEWLHKPLLSCPRCNSFWVATAQYFLIWQGHVWWEWLLIGGCAIGLADIILTMQTRLKDIADVIEEGNEPASMGVKGTIEVTSTLGTPISKENYEY